MKKTKKILIISCITILVVSMITNTFAVTQKDAENVKSQINDTEEEIKKVESSLSNAMKEIQELEGDIAEVEYNLEKLQANLKKLNNEISELEKKLEQAEKDYDERYKIACDRVVSQYKYGSRLGSPPCPKSGFRRCQDTSL